MIQATHTKHSSVIGFWWKLPRMPEAKALDALRKSWVRFTKHLSSANIARVRLVPYMSSSVPWWAYHGDSDTVEEVAPPSGTN